MEVERKITFAGRRDGNGGAKIAKLRDIFKYWRAEPSTSRGKVYRRGAERNSSRTTTTTNFVNVRDGALVGRNYRDLINPSILEAA